MSTDPFDLGPWRATVTRARWGYRVRVHRDLIERTTTWWRPTRQGAERLGRRIAGREQRQVDRENAAWEVHP